MPIDAKVVRLSKMIGVEPKAKSYDNISIYNKVSDMLFQYAPSTAEDYIWRLVRFLDSGDIKLIDKYIELLDYYKGIYDHGYLK